MVLIVCAVILLFFGTKLALHLAMQGNVPAPNPPDISKADEPPNPPGTSLWGEPLHVFGVQECAASDADFCALAERLGAKMYTFRAGVHELRSAEGLGADKCFTEFDIESDAFWLWVKLVGDSVRFVAEFREDAVEHDGGEENPPRIKRVMVWDAAGEERLDHPLSPPRDFLIRLDLGSTRQPVPGDSFRYRRIPLRFVVRLETDLGTETYAITFVNNVAYAY